MAPSTDDSRGRTQLSDVCTSLLSPSQPPSVEEQDRGWDCLCERSDFCETEERLHRPTFALKSTQ